MKRSALNDGNGKQKEMRLELSDRRMTRSASKQQQLEEEENRRIQEFPDTLYQFTKILRVYSLKKLIYAAYHITFQAVDESSTKNFEAKAGSFGDVTVVPFCKLEKAPAIC